MDIYTHKHISPALCGEPVEVRENFSRIRLKTSTEMTVDDFGLIHGGFVFGLADYAAMIAVNDPNVVLGAADVKFLAPVKKGDELIAEAMVKEIEGKKRTVSVFVERKDTVVFKGSFTCFVLDQHVLDKD